MKDSDNPDAWVQIHLPNDNALRPIGAVWNPLQFLGILKVRLWRSAVEWAGTLAPAAKSYGYWQTLVEPMEFNDFQQEI